jgi:hypothetical protein
MLRLLTTRSRARCTAVAALACAIALTGTSAALAGTSATRKSNRKTFILPASTTKTFNVGYPVALKYKNAKYSCTATVSGLGKKNVKILSRRSALGGTVCRVKARNTAKLPSLDTTANVRVTATTTY